MTDPLVDAYPPFGLRISHGPMVLRVFRDDDLPEYLELIAQPIFPDESVEWVFPWYRTPLEERRTSALQAHWGWRSTFSPERWQLAFGVYVDDELVGCQDVGAQDFARRRVVDTGSWLTLAHHGKGWGTRMRQLMLHFAFDHLGAWKAQSSAVIGNKASLGVSFNAGYQLDGQRVEIHGDKALQLQHVATPPMPLLALMATCWWRGSLRASSRCWEPYPIRPRTATAELRRGLQPRLPPLESPVTHLSQEELCQAPPHEPDYSG